MHCTYFKGNYETRVICDMWKHALIARINQQTCARCEKKTLPCFICGERLRSMHRMFRTCKTVENKTSETRQDKTRRTKHDIQHLPQRSPPRMRRMLGMCKTIQDKTRQDKTDKTRRITAEIPASDAVYGRDPRRGCSSDCFGSARLTMEDKTRQDGRNTAHYIFQNRREHHLGCRNAPEVQDCGRRDKTRQDKTDKTQHTTYRATDKTRRTEHKSIYRTMIPASDASNVSDVRDYGKQDRQDGRNTTHDI